MEDNIIQFGSMNLEPFRGPFPDPINLGGALLQFAPVKPQVFPDVDAQITNVTPFPKQERVLVPVPQSKKRIGIYAGSFNPFHNGHLNVAQKAQHLFDKVVIVRGRKASKDLPSYGLADIQALASFEVRECTGLLTDFIAENYKGQNVTLVRGLRNVIDLNEEISLNRYYQDLMPGLEIIHIICDREFEHISSSAIRELEKFGKGRQYMPT